MSDASESWLPVVGWEGLYEVSDLGRVRSLDRLVFHSPGSARLRSLRGKVLQLRPSHDGYNRVGLYGGHGKSVDAYVAVLVATAFLGPCPEAQEVLHGPAGHGDDRLANLSYGTHIANCEDRARDRAGHAKLTRALAAEIRRRVAAGERRYDLAAEYGVTHTTISRVVNGQRWYLP
jgi:NUMOD4 motif